MPDRHLAAEVRAAGAVLWRPVGGGAQLALVHRPKYDDWSFPKGKVDPGEHVLQTAVREVAEETGQQVTLGRRLAPVRYLLDDVPKRVDYWLATADSPAPFTATSEVDELGWCASGAAAARLSYSRDLATLADFRAGPRRTVPLILIRHASAGSKSAWRKDDLSRPLDSRGKKDARTLASLLRCFGVSRVVSSPAKRCTATVSPFAAGIDAKVEVAPAFAPTGKDAADAAAAATVAADLAAAGGPVVICAHRENLPAILEATCAQLGAEVPAERPLRKGEFLVLHRAGRTLAAAERYHPDGRY
jgi:8-oxo-dGTP diphosphatase